MVLIFSACVQHQTVPFNYPGDVNVFFNETTQQAAQIGLSTSLLSVSVIGTLTKSKFVMRVWVYPCMSVDMVETEQLLMLCAISKPKFEQLSLSLSLCLTRVLKTDFRDIEQMSSACSHRDLGL